MDEVNLEHIDTTKDDIINSEPKEVIINQKKS